MKFLASLFILLSYSLLNSCMEETDKITIERDANDSTLSPIDVNNGSGSDDDPSTDSSDSNSDNETDSGTKDNSNTTKISCPKGYIPVSGNSEFSTDDFCVMKWEARGSGSNISSNPEDKVYVNIQAADAHALCRTQSASGFSGTFTLIANDHLIIG